MLDGVFPTATTQPSYTIMQWREYARIHNHDALLHTCIWWTKHFFVKTQHDKTFHQQNHTVSYNRSIEIEKEITYEHTIMMRRRLSIIHTKTFMKPFYMLTYDRFLHVAYDCVLCVHGIMRKA